MPSSAPYRMLCIRKMPPDRHHQDRVRRGVRRSQLHSASAEAAKAPYPLAPSSFPNCDRCAGSQFGVIWGGQMHRGTELLHDGGTGCTSGFGSSLSFLHRARRFFSFSRRERKEWGANRADRAARPCMVQPKQQGAAIGRPIYRSNSTPLNRNRPDIIRAFWYLTSHRSAR